MAQLAVLKHLSQALQGFWCLISKGTDPGFESIADKS